MPLNDDWVMASANPKATTSSMLGEVILSLAWKFGSVVSVFAVIAVGLLYVKQDSLLYFPEIGGMPRRPGNNPRRYRSPAEHKIPYETHMIQTEDGVSIHSWLLLHPNSLTDKIPTIIFFHGNAGNIGLRLPNAIEMFNLLNANILMVEYRGYGDSETVNPSEVGLKKDAEASLRFLSNHPQIDPKRIFLFGRSLGGAVAIHLAKYAQHQQRVGDMQPLAGVIVENTFLSISKMVDQLMPFLSPFKFLVLKINWDSSKLVSSIQTPILYLSGASDELVPAFHMKQLHELSMKGGSNNPCVRMHIIKDGTHNETWMQGGMLYWEKIKSFMAESISIQVQSAPSRSDSINAITCDDNGSNIEVINDSEMKKLK